MSKAIKAPLWLQTHELMSDGKWRSAAEICNDLGISEATAITARIRDIRQFTQDEVICRVVDGVYRYQLVTTQTNNAA